MPRAQTSLASRGMVFPLSFAQERLWMAEQMTGGSPVYNMTEGWRLKGPLNKEALQGSLNEIARRQESLRTVFGQSEEGPVQIVLPPAPFDLTWADLSQAKDQEAELKEVLEQEARR